MRAITVSCFLAVVLLGLPAAGLEFEHAATRQLLDAEQTLRANFVTPHLDWGSPLPGGPLRALFVIHVETPGTNAREVVELCQRFDLRADVVFEKDGMIYGGEAGRQRLRDLLRRRYHVFVLGQVPLSLLGYRQQYELLRQVAENGAGVVCIGPRREPILNEARRLASGSTVLGPAAGLGGLIPSAPGAASQPLADRIATGYRLKRGRGVWIDYSPLLPQGRNPLTPRLPFSWGNLARYEHWSALVGRAVLWAAGRELPIAVTRSPLEGKSLEAGRQHRELAALLALNPGPGVRWEGSVCRLEDGVRLPVPLIGQGREVWADLPPLRAGDYMLELQARSGRMAAGFAAIPFRVSAPQRVTTLRLSADFVEPGHSLSATAAVEGPVMTGDLLRVRARDSFGREVWRQDLPLTGRQPLHVSFLADERCTLAMRLEAAWLRGDRELCCRTAPFKVTTRARGHFNMVMWDAPEDVLGYYAVQRMTEAGFNVNLRSGPPLDTVAAWGWAQVPYTTRILDEYDGDGRMQPFCWNDEAAVQAHVTKIAQAYLPSRQHGAYLYSLGDETTTLGASTDSADLAAYRRWLATQYGTVAALNQSWGSSYQSFEQVDLLGRGKFTGRELALEQEALERGLTARWFDRQAFARANYLRLCRRFGEAYLAMDPQALTGFEGAGGFFECIDDIVAANGFWTPYGGPGDEVLRCVAPAGYPHSNWIGYAHDVPPILADSMRLIANDCTSLFWWRWDNIGLFHGYLAPDLDFFPTTARLSQEMAPFRWGVGDWLMGAQRRHDGIALFHSLAAALAPRAIPGMFEEQCELAHRGAQAALEDMGLQYAYLTEQMVLAGKLTYPQIKVLVLPQTHALHPQAAARIRDFVAAGGMVIADALPGRFDHHLAPQRRPLDDLFLGERARVLRQPLVGYEAPRTDAPDGRDGPQGAALRRELAALLARAGITCPLGLTLASGNQVPPRVELVRWEREGVTLIGVFRYPPSSATAPTGPAVLNLRLALHEPRFVHLLGTRQRPFRAQALTLRLAPGQAAFVAAFPDQPTPLGAEAPQVVRPGEAYRLRLSSAGPGVRPVRLELVSPDGVAVPWAGRSLLAAESLQVPLWAAYDDRPGAWTIRLTDWFTGAVREVPVRIAAAAQP